MKKIIILFLIFMMFALAMTATAGMADTAATPAVTTESNAERDGDTVMVSLRQERRSEGGYFARSFPEKRDGGKGCSDGCLFPPCKGL